MRNVLIFTTLLFACTTGYLWVSLRAERISHALTLADANGYKDVTQTYTKAFAEVKSADAKFVAMAESQTTSFQRMLRKYRKQGQPQPAAPAVRFDTIYIPISSPPEVITDVLLPDTNACAEYVQRAVTQMQHLYDRNQAFTYSSPTGNLYLRGALHGRAVRIDSLTVPTALVMHERLVRARGIAGLGYNEREISVLAANPLVQVTPRETYVSREPNKLLRILRGTGLFLAGAASSYVVTQYMPE